MAVGGRSSHIQLCHRTPLISSEQKLSSSMYDVCGGNLVYRICCCCSSFVLFHYVWHLLSPQLIISKKFFFRTPSTSTPSREEMRALSDFKLFRSERGKSEHLSKNLSDSLNIYVDLFQLIDFLSMLLLLRTSNVF